MIWTKKQIAEGKKRLAATADLLEISPDEKFNMGIWHGSESNGLNPNTTLKACGTVACAFGHAIAAFPQLFIDYDNNVHVIENGSDFVSPNVLGAAAYFYRIETSLARKLFLPPDTARVSKKTVIRRIRKAAA